MEKNNDNIKVEVRETGIVTDTNTEKADDRIYVIDGLVVPKWLYDKEIANRRVG